MSFPAYLSIVTTRQGVVKGSVTQKGREGTMLVLSARHEIVAPRDPMSGRPTGKRVHKPFIVTKPVDRSSPILYDLIATNENLPLVVLQFVGTTAMGVEKSRYTVALTNANISAIYLKMPNIRSEKLVRLSEYEEISFTYQRIEWTWLEGNVTAIDDWERPR